MAGWTERETDSGEHRTVPQYGGQVPLPTQGQALAAAEAEGIAQDGPAPSEEQLTRIHELLLARGCTLSYQSVRRFVIKRNWPGFGRSTVRMEDTPPGEVAEADFGRLGLIPDQETGKRRVVWAMLIFLCHSRHCFLWPLHQQTLPEVIAGLEAAWAFFGSMPKYLFIDNFPAVVMGPDPLQPP